MTGVEDDRTSHDEVAGHPHGDMVAQPHSEDEGPVAEAEQLAAKLSSSEQPLGSPGPRFDRRSPFYIGLMASAGVAVTYAAVRVLASMSSMLVLIGVAFFLALGLEPAVSWFVKRKLPRWAAITLVFVIFLALMGAFVAAAIPPLAQQAGQLIDQAPHYIQQAQDHSSTIGRLNERFHLQQRITDTLNGSGGSVLEDVVTAGSAVFGALAHVLIVIVFTVYFLVDLPRIRTAVYRLIPHTRRPRAQPHTCGQRLRICQLKVAVRRARRNDDFDRCTDWFDTQTLRKLACRESAATFIGRLGLRLQDVPFWVLPVDELSARGLTAGRTFNLFAVALNPLLMLGQQFGPLVLRNLDSLELHTVANQGTK